MTSLQLGWALLLEAMIESWRFAKPVMQGAWIWIALYFATYLVFDYFLHTNEEAYVLVLLGTLIMLVVLVAHMAVRCHRLILASKIEGDLLPERVYCRYALRWLLVGVVASFSSLAFGLLGYGLIEAFDHLIGPFFFGAGATWDMATPLVIGACSAASMYVFYRIGMALPTLALGRRRLSMRESWCFTRRISRPLIWICVACGLFFAIYVSVWTFIEEFFAPTSFYEHDRYSATDFVLSPASVAMEILFTLIGASLFSVLYRAADKTD